MQNHNVKKISSAGKQLLEFFERNGCVRYPDLNLRKKAGCMNYKFLQENINKPKNALKYYVLKHFLQYSVGC